MSYLPELTPKYSDMKIVTSTPSTGQVIGTSASTCDGSSTNYSPSADDDTVIYQYTFYTRPTDTSGMKGRAQFTLQESSDGVSYSDVAGCTANEIFTGATPLVKRLITLRFRLSAHTGLKYFRVVGQCYNSSAYSLTLHTPDFWAGTPSMVYNPTSTIYGFREVA